MHGRQHSSPLNSLFSCRPIGLAHITKVSPLLAALGSILCCYLSQRLRRVQRRSHKPSTSLCGLLNQQPAVLDISGMNCTMTHDCLTGKVAKDDAHAPPPSETPSPPRQLRIQHLDRGLYFLMRDVLQLHCCMSVLVSRRQDDRTRRIFPRTPSILVRRSSSHQVAPSRPSNMHVREC